MTAMRAKDGKDFFMAILLIHCSGSLNSNCLNRSEWVSLRDAFILESAFAGAALGPGNEFHSFHSA
jgi:hypothetical protein